MIISLIISLALPLHAFTLAVASGCDGAYCQQTLSTFGSIPHCVADPTCSNILAGSLREKTTYGRKQVKSGALRDAGRFSLPNYVVFLAVLFTGIRAGRRLLGRWKRTQKLLLAGAALLCLWRLYVWYVVLIGAVSPPTLREEMQVGTLILGLAVAMLATMFAAAGLPRRHR